MLIKSFGEFQIRDSRGTIELNAGGSMHIHVGGLKITMKTTEFERFTEILKEAENALNRMKKADG